MKLCLACRTCHCLFVLIRKRFAETKPFCRRGNLFVGRNQFAGQRTKPETTKPFCRRRNLPAASETLLPKTKPFCRRQNLFDGRNQFAGQRTKPETAFLMATGAYQSNFSGLGKVWMHSSSTLLSTGLAKIGKPLRGFGELKERFSHYAKPSKKIY